MEETKVVQHKPIIEINHIFEHETSDYPDFLRVPMDDGQVIKYRRVVTQPQPQLQKSLELIRLMNENIHGGYQYKKSDAKKGGKLLGRMAAGKY